MKWHEQLAFLAKEVLKRELATDKPFFVLAVDGTGGDDITLTVVSSSGVKLAITLRETDLENFAEEHFGK